MKIQVVNEYLSNTCSLLDLVNKYKISSKDVVRNWVLMYNKGKVLSDIAKKRLNVIKEFTNGTGSPAVKYDEAFKNIYEGVKYIYENTPNSYELAYISLGVSGLGAVEDVLAFEQSFTNLYHVPCKIVTDCEASLHAILKNELNSGILVVAGTGNATFGINKDLSLIVGGGGPLLNEQGSCYS